MGGETHRGVQDLGFSQEEEETTIIYITKQKRFNTLHSNNSPVPSLTAGGSALLDPTAAFPESRIGRISLLRVPG